MSMERNEFIEKGNAWLRSISCPYEDIEGLIEYADGQLETAIELEMDCIANWDRWQHLQACMGIELSLELAGTIENMLWENDIEIMELETEESKQYYLKRGFIS